MWNTAFSHQYRLTQLWSALHSFLVNKKIWLCRLLQWANNPRTWNRVLKETPFSVRDTQAWQRLGWFRLMISRIVLSRLQLTHFPPFLVPLPRTLYETCSPRSPLMWVEPELVSNLFTTQFSVLWGYKFQVLGDNSKCLHLCNGFDCTCGRW